MFARSFRYPDRCALQRWRSRGEARPQSEVSVRLLEGCQHQLLLCTTSSLLCRCLTLFLVCPSSGLFSRPGPEHTVVQGLTVWKNTDDRGSADHLDAHVNHFGAVPQVSCTVDGGDPRSRRFTTNRPRFGQSLPSPPALLQAASRRPSTISRSQLSWAKALRVMAGEGCCKNVLREDPLRCRTVPSQWGRRLVNAGCSQRGT